MMITFADLPNAIKVKIESRLAMTPDKVAKIGSAMAVDMQSKIEAGLAQPPSQKMSGAMVDKHGIKRSRIMVKNEQTLLRTGVYSTAFEAESVNDKSFDIVNQSHVKPVWPRIHARSMSVVDRQVLVKAIKEAILAV